MTPTPRDCEPGVTSVNSPWSAGDVGSPAPGSAVQEDTDTFFICGSGSTIWSGEDHFHYVSRSTDDSFEEIIIRVSHFDGSVSSWTKFGPMIRSSNARDAAYFMVRMTGGNGVSTQWRSNDGDGWSSSSGLRPDFDVPVYLRLTKNGNTMTGYYGYDGSNWTELHTQTNVNLGTDFLVGVAAGSQNDGRYVDGRVEIISIR
jgi:hypothetical protein